MSRIIDFFADIAGRVSSTEIAVLAGLVALAVAGLVVPFLMSQRSRQQFTDRDEEFRRLQNM